MEMKLLGFLLGFIIVAARVQGRCYDKYNNIYYEQGMTFRRSKPMGESTLLGEYECDCRSGGFLYCKAYDIPCYDSIRKAFVPKYEYFDRYFEGSTDLYSCQCQGMRGRFGPCTLVQNCRDVHTREEVTSGQYFITREQGYMYRCLCVNGRKASLSCARVIEEAFDPCGVVNCDSNAKCIPNGATYSCRCLEGFRGDGFSCSDLNECLIATATCDLNARCQNTEGSYRCTCRGGFRGDGHSCRRLCIDEAHNTIVNDETFITLRYGVRMRCTCEGGEEVIRSCEPLRRGCLDASTGELVESGRPYVERRGQLESRCTCENGAARQGSCIPIRPRITSTQRPVTTRKSPTDTEGKCFDRSRGQYHELGESYTWKRGLKSYICTCTRRRSSVLSRCVQDKN